MEYSFVTYLGTDNFLPGVLTLGHSLMRYNKKYELVVLVNETVSDNIIDLLIIKKIQFKIIKEIKNPQNLGDDKRNFKYMYTKLRIFEMFEYDKIVYLDADMLVCNNIEELFACPHMSAVIAGGLVPSNKLWKDLNAGLMVIEPDKNTFITLYSSINNLPSDDGSDQGFLHSFYESWPLKKSLHLNHKFNVPSCYIDEYCKSYEYRFSYTGKLLDTNISVIHYWGRYKPWEINIKQLKKKSTSKVKQALILWWDIFLEAATDIYY
jgi:alpha-N-acetylglucosamine transferase